MKGSRRLNRDELEDTIEYLKEIIKVSSSKKEISELKREIWLLSRKIDKMLEYQARKNEDERFLHPVADYHREDGKMLLGCTGCYRITKKPGAS